MLTDSSFEPILQEYFQKKGPEFKADAYRRADLYFNKLRGYLSEHNLIPKLYTERHPAPLTEMKHGEVVPIGKVVPVQVRKLFVYPVGPRTFNQMRNGHVLEKVDVSAATKNSPV